MQEDLLIKRNSNTIRLLRNLIRDKRWEDVFTLGNIIRDDHPSIRKTFCIITGILYEPGIVEIRNLLNNELEEELGL